jgi:hypothetical protein
MHVFFGFFLLTDIRASITVPPRKPWTPSTHATWSLAEQHSVHMATVTLWRVRKLNPQMHLPYELVELILKQVDK